MFRYEAGVFHFVSFFLTFFEGGLLERTISVVQVLATKPTNRTEILSSFDYSM